MIKKNIFSSSSIEVDRACQALISLICIHFGKVFCIDLSVVQAKIMTAAEYIAYQLKKNRIRNVFGIPGGASIPYIEAFSNAGIEFILTSNEAAAGIMADVSARLTGIPGVCHATFGPGAANLITGIGGALLDRSPVIAITSEMNNGMLNRTTQMNISHQKLFRPVVKATFRLNPENTAEEIETAFRLCCDEYPGPVHLGLPSDLAEKEIRLSLPVKMGKAEKKTHFEIKTVLSLLNNYHRPLLAAGLTSARLNLGGRIVKLLESNKMPVLLTPMAKGIIPENHPCYAGVLFHSLSNYLDPLIKKADLVIGLGYDPVEFNYESWMPDVPLLHFDTRKTDMPESIESHQVTGRPEDWFDLLGTQDAVHSDFNPEDIQRIQKEITSAFGRLTNHFGPVTVVKVLQEELPPDAILTADVGSHLHLLGQYWQTHGHRNLIMSNGWSGMGFGIPAALAAQMIRRETTVACVTGDGGFLMMAGEIITAKRYNLPVIFVVISDGELNLIRLKKSWQNLSPAGTQLYSGDLFGTNTFFNIKVLDAVTETEMRLAVRESLLMKEPVIINAKIDPSDYIRLIVKR
jgi:acetolactate synthase-1/2/3 large subunit